MKRTNTKNRATSDRMRINFKTIPLEFSKLESTEREHIALFTRCTVVFFMPHGRSLTTLTEMFFKANRKKQYH